MTFVAASYASAAAAYGLLTLVLVLRREPQQRQGLRVLYVVAGTAVWGFAIALLVSYTGGTSGFIPAVDALRTSVLVFCLLVAVPGKVTVRSFKGAVSIAAALAAAVAAAAPFVGLWVTADLALLGLAIIGFLAVEQIVRNATAEQKQVVGLFLYTIGALLAYDLFVFSDAVLFRSVDVQLWGPRGFLAALALPFFLLAAKRHSDWRETIFISREFVFYTATLTGVGIYLLAMAAVGFIIQRRGGEWSAAIQFAYLVAALIVLGFIVSSARLKSQLRVFISKHFYRNRYDYRDEWLRLIRTLSDSDQALPIDQRSIKALCEIVGSDGGQLWLDRETRSRYEPFAAWQAEFPSKEYDGSSALVRFLKEQRWVIDSAEHDRDPELYNHAFRDAGAELPARSFIVPLFHQHELLGFARLVRPEKYRQLNYEDHDLLKTAGRQVAAFLAHGLAMEQLAENRQFQAYSKLSAFVMHDLKNLLSQQALLVENAKKFQHRPEFVADVIKTVDHGVHRMRRLLRQLEPTPSSIEQRVEINELVRDVVAERAAHGPVKPELSGHRPLWVHAQADRLSSLVAHVIANAQEATKAGDRITVSVGEKEGRALIEIRDTGEGMTQEFIRRRLFKPFDTTKGSSGMGIGAYQTREFVRSLGGDLIVESSLGVGTTVSILLPIIAGAASGQAEVLVR